MTIIKSIFGKHLLTYMTIMLLSFSVMGFTLAGFFKNYFFQQRTNTLYMQSEQISNILKNYLIISQSFIIGQREEMAIQNELLLRITVLKETINADIFVVNSEHYVFSYTEGIDYLELQTQIKSTDFAPLEKGEVTIKESNFNGFLDEQYLVAAYPVMFDGNFLFGVYALTPVSDINQNFMEILQIILSILLITSVITLVFIYLSSRKISKPLKKMSEAAKKIAMGDFDKRLAIESKDEVGILAASFNNMAESLENQEKSRKDFISNISHDLRSPLTSIKGFLQAIVDGTIPNELSNKYIGIVLEETDRLIKLSNDILDINKIKDLDIKLQCSNFDINDLIRKTVITYEGKIIEKNIELYLNFENLKSEVNGDSEKILRVVSNLIDNAIKFTNENGRIEIETKSFDDKIMISVEDNGCGIPQEDQKHIFERFYKVDVSRGEDKQGSGLGLAIVKEFIKAHGQSVSVTSEVGKGTKFIFTLEKARIN